MKDALIVALDFDSLEDALKMVDILYPTVKIFKIGHQLFLKNGWNAVWAVRKRGAEVFLDLKLFDIPNTVSKAAAIMAKEDIFMFNVHALGGHEMMRQTVKEVRTFNKKILVIAVTILTSFDETALRQIGFENKPDEEVIKLALLSKEAGLDGVVASPREVEIIKKNCGKNFIVVCPGIRSADVSMNDQKRTATAPDAVSRGADYIVVGRPVTKAVDPLTAAKQIKEQIENV